MLYPDNESVDVRFVLVTAANETSERPLPGCDRARLNGWTWGVNRPVFGGEPTDW